ncbi:MAG: OmpP1/FadL family transporter [Sulfuricaulis sp.]
MKYFTKQALASAFALALTAPVTAFATNGMDMIGYGAKATGMGGAGVAYPQDAMITAYNPAGMTEIGEMRLDLTLEIFHPPRAVSADGTIKTDVRSKNDWFPIPALGAVMSNPVTPLSLGMAVVGAGLGTNYPQAPKTFYNVTGTAYKNVGVFLMQMQMLPSIAYKLDEHNSIGASLVIAMQTFRAYGLEDFTSGVFNFTSSTNQLTNRGYNWSFGGGYKLGWLGTYFDKKLDLGFDFEPKVHMQRFDEYRGLFANHGEFDIPEKYTGGLSYKFTPKTAIAFDVERILWHKVPSIGHPGPTTSGVLGQNPLCPGGSNSPECSLGGSLGMGFGWTNQTVYKLGVDHKYNEKLTLRGGLNYGKSPIPADQVMFNMLAPATSTYHFTAGATWTRKDDSDITLTLMHSPKKVIKGPTMFPGGSAAIAMSQTSLSIAYGLQF